MQQVSKQYKKSIKSRLRNRGYIRVRIGVINSKAQDHVAASDSRNEFAYFSDSIKPFDDYEVTKIYATAEKNLSRVDGSMYFLPKESEGLSYYNNGIVTKELSGTIYINFIGNDVYDIKGLTINFGECYPSLFDLETNSGIKTYKNDRQIFVTEDVFDGTTYFIIRPINMVNEYGRLRIFEFLCGILNVFTNKNVKNYSMKDYVSTITETIPSQDMSLVVDNQNLYYSADNPESTLAYMEIGQEVKVAFGYDVDGKGHIEWLPENILYLKTWSANDIEAKFTATDRLGYLSGTYYKGECRPEGISLYDLAIDVLDDAGIIDEREWFVDPYLKNVIVYNPIPPLRHSEALQIISNAGRCAMYEDRKGRLCIRASFVPDMYASSDDQTPYSHMDLLLKDRPKRAYAICSNDFSVVDGSLFFMPKNPDEYFEDAGYVSNSVSDLDGNFENPPKITINLEAGFVAFGLIVRFRNVAPQEFRVITYYQEEQVFEKTVEFPDLECVLYDEFWTFDKMELVFTKGHPNARITIESILINDITDYRLSWKKDIITSPISTRNQKVKSISIKKTIYSESQKELSDLVSEEIMVPYDEYEYEVIMQNPSYNFTSRVEGGEGIRCEILESSNYRLKIRFIGITSPDTLVKYAISGYEYGVSEQYLKIPCNETGEEKEWSNPLISTNDQARELEEWLATYYLGDVNYEYTWRGDPSTDANDLFYLDLKERENVLVREYEHTLTFNGAWNCKSKARRAIVSWR